MEPTDFFVAGGTLRPQSPSYVPRPADDALLNHLLAGEFCYVLTPRQMGKSSLMVRTAARLREQEIQTVIIDLTSIGSVTVDEWYLGLLSRIRSGLRLEVDVQEWWQAQMLGAAQRFSTFLRDEVLGKTEEHIVIFIDEIDSTLNLDFRDDFFAAVRALYNARANEPIFQRLSFAFLGVATPTELIQDRQRTPFNIGRRIDLQEFSFDDACPLQEGLDTLLPNQGQALLQRIFHWTSGHPYLTQKLCLLIAHHPERAWNDGEIDTLVARSFLSEEGRKDTNLTFIQDRLLSSPALERRALLTLYRQVYSGKALPDDDRSPVQNRLELYGLLKVKDKLLHVRNEIYRHVFNGEWITVNTPVNSQRRVAIGSVLIALMVVTIGLIASTMQPIPSCDAFVRTFRESPDSQTVRISALANLFDQAGRCNMDGLNLFYDLPKAEQKKLFLFENPQSVQADLRAVVDKLSRTLDWSDEDLHDQELMDKMIAQLKQAGFTENDSLVQMLQHWVKGRVMARAKNFDGAVVEYTVAMKQVADHPVLHYDRAMAYIELGNYSGALEELDEVVRIAQMAPPTPTPTPSHTPTSLSTPTSTRLLTPSPSPLPTSSPAATSSLFTRMPTNQPTSVKTPNDMPTSARFTPTSTTPFALATPTAVPTLIAYSRKFLDSGNIIEAVKETIQEYPALLVYWNENSVAYEKLGNLGLEVTLVFTPTPTVVPASNSTPTSTPDSDEVGQQTLTIVWSLPILLTQTIDQLIDDCVRHAFDVSQWGQNFTGTLDYSANGQVNYRSNPRDRLRVIGIEGTRVDFWISNFQGSTTTGPDDYLRNNYQLSCRAQSANSGDLTVSVERTSDGLLNRTRLVQTEGTLLNEEHEYEVAAQVTSTIYFESSFGGSEYRNQTQIKGDIHYPTKGYELK